MRSPKSTDDVFWEKVSTPDALGCWEWTGNKSRGYGLFGISSVRSSSGKDMSVRAHRYAHECVNGTIPEGLVIDHLCSNKLCCNPTHLQAVTIRENTLRYYRGRAKCKHGHFFTPENSLIGFKGERVCRTCVNAAQRAYTARKKAVTL